MTSTSPCKLVRYEDYSQNKRSANYRCTRPAGHPTLIQNINSSKPSSDYGFGAEKIFDDQLREFENIARHRYSKILSTLACAKLPGWFDQMLEQSVFPTLHRIGFDKQLSKMLFEIASSSWKLMGPLNEKIIAFNPAIDQEIEEVRQGLKLKACKNSTMFPRSAGAPLEVISGNIKNNISPESIFDLLDEIATPWIILPRAFRFLKKRHCRYLPAYLKTIDRETRESCLKLFSRITVEFVANFSLKFADRHHPPAQLTKLLFYGYSALFWKTLRCPPENLENSAAFDTFFNWINRLTRKSDALGNEEKKSIDRMIERKTMAFPTNNFMHPQKRSRPDNSRFLLTLRHGYIGMTTILKYFGIDQFLESRLVGERFACPSIQNELHGLLHTIQTNYNLESKRTRGYIKQFIGHLRSAYELMQPAFDGTERRFWNRKLSNLQILLVK